MVEENLAIAESRGQGRELWGLKKEASLQRHGSRQYEKINSRQLLEMWLGYATCKGPLRHATSDPIAVSQAPRLAIQH